VTALAGSQSAARFISVGPRTLKGFDTPIEVFNIEGRDDVLRSMFVDVDRHAQLTVGLVAQLDYWETLPALQRLRDAMLAEVVAFTMFVACGRVPEPT
jgi:hypothetical protein